jgi:diguanylate cyclase (GGDEF)-like protein
MTPTAATGNPSDPSERAVSTALAALVSAHAGRLGHAVSVKHLDSGRYVYANEAMSRLLGAGGDSILGQTDATLLGAARAAPLRAADETATAAWPNATHAEHRFEWDDRRLRQQVTRIALAEADGATPHWIASMWTDLSVLEDREAALQRALRQIETEQAALRQLREQLAAPAGPVVWPAARGNSFEEQLRRESDLSSREQREFSLVLVELDPPSVAPPIDAAAARARAIDALDRLMVSNIRAMDSTSRLGEDRFAVLLSGVGLATAHSRIEGLRRQCATQVLALDGREFGLTISVGIASFPHTAASRDALVQAATQALAEARNRGGNQVKLASIRFAPE